MAVTVEGTPTTGVAVATASSITFSHTVGATATGLFVGSGNSNQLTSTVTFNGASLDELWDVFNTTIAGRASGSLMVNPAITTANVVVTWAASVDIGQAGAVGLAGLENASVAAAHRTVYTANDLASAPTITVVDSVTDDLVIDSAYTFAGTIAVDAGQTSRCADDSIAGGTGSWGISTEVAVGASTVMSWTGGSLSCTGAMALVAVVSGLTTEYVAPVTAEMASAMIGRRYV